MNPGNNTLKVTAMVLLSRPHLDHYEVEVTLTNKLIWYLFVLSGQLGR